MRARLLAHQPQLADLHADEAHVRAAGDVQRGLPDAIDLQIDPLEARRRNGVRQANADRSPTSRRPASGPGRRRRSSPRRPSARCSVRRSAGESESRRASRRPARTGSRTGPSTGTACRPPAFPTVEAVDRLRRGGRHVDPRRGRPGSTARWRSPPPAASISQARGVPLRARGGRAIAAAVQQRRSRERRHEPELDPERIRHLADEERMSGQTGAEKHHHAAGGAEQPRIARRAARAPAPLARSRRRARRRTGRGRRGRARRRPAGKSCARSRRRRSTPAAARGTAATCGSTARRRRRTAAARAIIRRLVSLNCSRKPAPR